MSFKAIKFKVIGDLLAGNFAHEARNDIDEKNLLASGEASASEVADLLKRCRSQDHTSSPHHQDASIEVHIFKVQDWYVKFYFDEDTVFISVHK